MKVAWTNPSQPVKAYACQVCGNRDVWTDQHRYILRPVGSKYNPYEVYFITCSAECQANAKEPFIAWLSKYEGWTKRTAQQNFEGMISE